MPSNYSLSREDAKGEVGPGWAVLIDELYDNLPPGISVVGIKEKYAGLRIDYGADEPFPARQVQQSFQDAVSIIEERSETICEYCGSPGTLHRTPGHWLKTMCQHCAVQRGAKPCR